MSSSQEETFTKLCMSSRPVEASIPAWASVWLFSCVSGDGDRSKADRENDDDGGSAADRAKLATSFSQEPLAS